MANNSYIYLVGLVVLVVAFAYLANNYLPQTTFTTDAGYRQTLANFAKSNLRSAYTVSYATKNFTYPVVTHPFKKEYIATWNAQGANFTVYLVKNSNDENIKFIKGAVFVPTYLKGLNLTAAPFYLNMTGNVTWKCRNLLKSMGKVCENFYQSSDDKHGQFVMMLTNGTVVVYCNIPKGSEFYGRNTCVF